MVRSPGTSCSGSKDGDGGVINKGPWTEAEDEILSRYVKAHGVGNWRLIPKLAGLSRCGKSCRLRWINYLRPNVKRGNFSVDEDNLILTLHALLGNRWSLIAGRIPGRTDNEIKNYWNTHLRRKLRSMGVDPTSYKVGLTLTSSNTSDSFSSDPSSSDPSSSSRAADPNQHAPSGQQQVVSSPGDSASTSGTSFDDTSEEPDNNIESSYLSMHNVLSFHLLDWDHHSCGDSTSTPSSCTDQFRLEHLQLLDPVHYPLQESSSHQHDTRWTTGLFDSLLD